MEINAIMEKDEAARLAAIQPLPCPFCGSKASLKTDTPTAMAGSIVTYAFVECGKCKTKGPALDDWDNKSFKEDAVRDWNRRADDLPTK